MELESLRSGHGNWVQRFLSDEDASLFVTAQFSRYQEVEEFIKENFADQPKTRKPSRREGGKS